MDTPMIALTLAEIARRYPDQWVLVEETAWDAQGHPRRGIVHAASRQRAALWAPLQVLLFGRLNALLVGAARWLQPQGFGGVAVAQLLAVLPLLLPPTLLMGISFPLAVRAIHRERAHLGAQ